MIIDRLCTDWKRYDIQNAEYVYPRVDHVGPHLWELVDPVVFTWMWDLGRAGIMCPAGYRWDGASIPSEARGVVDPEAAFDASLVHDILYETQGGLRPYRVWAPWRPTGNAFVEDQLVDWYSGASPAITRERADAVLMAFWLRSGMPVGMAEAGYVAVHLFGQDAWNSEEPKA